MAKYVVATVDEIPPGKHKLTTVSNRRIGVFNIDGAFFALRNRCPHQGGPLCQGRILGHLVSEQPGEYRYDASRWTIRCPWHGWEFDVSSGQSWWDPERTRVPTYPVTIEDSGEKSDLVRGPYLAETYRVSVDRQSIVVEI